VILERKCELRILNWIHWHAWLGASALASVRESRDAVPASSALSPQHHHYAGLLQSTSTNYHHYRTLLKENLFHEETYE
jgi:hypothetical protein